MLLTDCLDNYYRANASAPKGILLMFLETITVHSSLFFSSSENKHLSKTKPKQWLFHQPEKRECYLTTNRQDLWFTNYYKFENKYCILGYT